jgi:trigger factor
MNINVEHQPNCRVIAHVDVPAEQVTKQRNDIVAYYSSIAKIPGFRPGKVPASIIMQRHKDAVNEELQSRLINAGCYEAIQKEKLEVLQVLNVKDQKFRDDGCFTFAAEIAIAPKFELPEYKGIPVKLAKVEATDHDIDHELFHLRENRATFEDLDRPAAKGDVVAVGYTISMDGKPLAETHPDLPDILKSTEENWFMLEDDQDFIKGFVEGMIGIKKDEARTLTLTIPDDFHVEELRGKTVELAATCKGVKERKLADINDEFVKTLLGDEGTVEQLREEVKNSILRRKEQGRDNELSNQVIAHLHDKLDFELPEHIVANEAQRRTNDIAQRAMRGGMSEDEVMSKQDEIVNSATQQAKQGVRVSFILEKIAEKEQLAVSDAQLSMALSQQAARSKMKPKQFMAQAEKSGLIERMRGDLRLDNALQFLKANAAIEEIEPSADKHDCAFEKGEAA